MSTSRLVWSEERQQFLAPGRFEQVFRTPDGANVRMTGDGFTANREFSAWQYYVVDRQPINLNYEGPSR